MPDPGQNISYTAYLLEEYQFTQSESWISVLKELFENNLQSEI